MSDNKNWFVSTSELEGKEVITRGRREMHYLIDSGEYNERVEIEWNYTPLSNGMPSQDKEDFMNEVAFKLQDALELDAVGFMVATFTGNNKFIIIFYTKNIDRFAEILNETLSQYEQLPLEIGRIEDPTWSEYKEMLKNDEMME